MIIETVVSAGLSYYLARKNKALGFIPLITLATPKKKLSVSKIGIASGVILGLALDSILPKLPTYEEAKKEIKEDFKYIKGKIEEGSKAIGREISNTTSKIGKSIYDFVLHYPEYYKQIKFNIKNELYDDILKMKEEANKFNGLFLGAYGFVDLDSGKFLTDKEALEISKNNKWTIIVFEQWEFYNRIKNMFGHDGISYQRITNYNDARMEIQYKLRHLTERMMEIEKETETNKPSLVKAIDSLKGYDIEDFGKPRTFKN